MNTHLIKGHFLAYFKHSADIAAVLEIVLNQIFYGAEFFKSPYLTFCVNEWTKLGIILKRIEYLVRFKKSLLDFIHMGEHSLFSGHDSNRLK